MDDGCKERWTHRKIMLLSHTLTMRGSEEASFVVLPSGLEGDSMTDKWTKDEHMDRQMHGKIMLSCTPLPYGEVM